MDAYVRKKPAQSAEAMSNIKPHAKPAHPVSCSWPVHDANGNPIDTGSASVEANSLRANDTGPCCREPVRLAPTATTSKPVESDDVSTFCSASLKATARHCVDKCVGEDASGRLFEANATAEKAVGEHPTGEPFLWRGIFDFD